MVAQTITFTLNYNEHDLPIIETPSVMFLSGKQFEKQISIEADKAGLIFLAEQLLALAYLPETEKNKDYHIHLDHLHNINDEGIEFILRKK